MAYMDRADEPTTSSTCAVTDSLSVSVTPSTLSDVTRAIPCSGDGGWMQHRFRLSRKMISTDFAWFNVRLLPRDHSSTLEIFLSRVSPGRCHQTVARRHALLT